MTPSVQVHGLFPTPVAHVSGVLTNQEAAELCERLAAQVSVNNNQTGLPAHTALLAPGQDPALDTLAFRLLPQLQAFGAQLLGEALNWSIKEMWANVLGTGAYQGLHNHANCLVSGIVYLTPTAVAARTVFVKGLGGTEFKLTHQHAGSRTGAYNAERWVAPETQPGDAILFPSYLLHEVPANPGGQRVTVAFNAIPDRLNAWGYQLGLSG
jgi:uncharacterized protein (TIGR02466 family)